MCMCPHTAIYMSSYLFICGCMAGADARNCPNVSAYYYMCVFILLYMCLHTTIYVSSGEEASGCPKKKRPSTWGADVNSGNEGVVGVGGYVCPHNTTLYVLLILLYTSLALLCVSWPYYYLYAKLGQRSCEAKEVSRGLYQLNLCHCYLNLCLY